MIKLEQAVWYLSNYTDEEICMAMIEHGCEGIEGLSRIELAQIIIDMIAADNTIPLFWNA